MSAAASVSVSDILEFLGDRVLDARTNPLTRVNGQASLSPGTPGCLTFASSRNEQTRNAVGSTLCAVVLVLPEYLDEAGADTSAVAVADPRLEFARCVQQFFVPKPTPGIHGTVVVADSAEIGPGASIGPGVVIGAGVRIGARVQLGANAVIGDGAFMGDDVVVGPGTVIGHVGFGYAREDDGTPVLLPHTGTVRIGDRVEIGANSAIDRGTIDDTIIEDDVKIDNLVHVGHNCRVRRGAFLITQTVLGGGVDVGERAWLAPHSTVLQNLTIGQGALVGMGAVVLKDVEEGAVLAARPARSLPPG